LTGLVIWDVAAVAERFGTEREIVENVVYRGASSKVCYRTLLMPVSPASRSAFKYGGGPGFGLRSEADVIAEQLPRLWEMAQSV
jgi:hypothetical protein